MRTKKSPSPTMTYLHDRYIGSDPERLVSLEEARINADIAQTIYDLRTKAGLTQSELAKLAGRVTEAIAAAAANR